MSNYCMHSQDDTTLHVHVDADDFSHSTFGSSEEAARRERSWVINE